MDDIMAGSENEAEGELNIARRTRSHLRIDDFVPNDNLDFPDVDMNLYQNPNSGGDPEYKKFLNQCYSEEIGNDTNTDDNDQDYVYNDDIFSHGWKFDLNEVSELHQDDTEFSDKLGSQKNVDSVRNDQPMGMLNVPTCKSPSKLSRRKIDMFADPEFARILNQQLRQHIQLLTQTYLLTKNTTNMRYEADEARSHLESYMKIFKHKSKPSNLLPAMELIDNLVSPRDLKTSIRLNWRPLPIPESVKTIIHDNPNIFIYPSLLPQVAFSILPERLAPKKPKINFTINEDTLLAYALNEFKGESAPYAFIASLLMTAKTKTQISNHIKNIKRSPGCEHNPIKLYYATGKLPEIDIDSDASLVELVQEEEFEIDHDMEGEQQEDERQTTLEEAREEVIEQPALENGNYFQDHDDLMNMDLDDLMAASTTISKSAILNVNNSENNKNLKNLKLKKSMLNLMSHNFLLSKDMGDLMIHEFLKAAQLVLSERNYLHLLQLLSDLTRTESEQDDQTVVEIYKEISNFLVQINAPRELHERVVLFLDLNQATKCGCAFSYLHWMRFFEFMQHVELYHDGVEAFEKKSARLIDALQKDDPHKIKLAIGNLVNKQPFLKRQFESLYLNEKPHPSLFICEEDFDDITDPLVMYDSNETNEQDIYKYEHFSSKLSQEELSYASQSCSCKCHVTTTADGQPSQHCEKCNLKFMKGRMYLVNKIKPILAEWSYVERAESSQTKNTSAYPVIEWTFEEDREILEFCRIKAEQNEETVSFDTSTFEELVNRRQGIVVGSDKATNSIGGSNSKKSAREIAERFNHLMEMYKDENLSSVGTQ